MAAATASPTTSVTDLALAAKAAARRLAAVDSATKDRALVAVAAALEARVAEILAANARDLEAGREAGLSDALIDRLTLSEARIRAIAAGTRAIAALPDPVGEVVDGGRLANGLDFRKVRVPLGVIAVVYEARPNVTIDAAALCLKSGNAVLLRGSSSAVHSNAVLARIARAAAEGAGLPAGALALVAGGGRAELAELAGLEGVVDLIIPRGGEGLKQALSAVARVPVIYAASGNCHVYVDAAADLEMAERIIVNAKVQRPGRVQRGGDAARALRGGGSVPPARAGGAARARRGAARRRARRGRSTGRCAEAVETDWAEEFLALMLAVRVVDSVDGGDRPRQPLRLRALRGDRDARPPRGAGVPARRRLRLRLRERLDAVHRRRRVRDGRRDRQLDPEAARARPDRPARALLDSLPGRRRRPDQGLRS